MGTFTGTSGDDVWTGGSGDDIASGGAGQDTLDGGGGNDHLAGGLGGDTLTGGDGDDQITAADFSDAATGVPGEDDQGDFDMISGGAGDDTIYAGVGDWADGGDGFDTLHLSLAGASLDGGIGFDTSDIITGVPSGFGGHYGTFTNFETIAYLRATGLADTLKIATEPGTITIDAGDGDDRVTANGSPVILHGDGGNDHFFSGSAADTFDGGDGNDTIDYSQASAGITAALGLNGAAGSASDGDQIINVENISGSQHDDSLAGNELTNALSGQAGDDSLAGGGGDDVLDGGAGNDILDGGDGSDVASYASASGPVHVDLSLSGPQDTGGAGTDTLSSIEGLIGSTDSDTLVGSAGNDWLSGGGGDDILHGGAGDDTLIGDGGNATADYSGDAAVIVDLSITGPQDTGGAGVDTLTSISSLIGSSGDDHLTGHGGTYDIIEGGLGDDVLDGGAGFEGTVSYEHAPGAVTVDLSQTAPQDTGSAGTDTLQDFGSVIGSDYDDTLRGTDGNNTINGGAGADQMYGGAGNDSYMVDNASDAIHESAGEGVDTAYAWVSYTLAANVEDLQLEESGLTGKGNGLANTITGAEGDKLLGLAGDDRLIAYEGNDILDGGTGNDSMSGGAGNDTYRVDSSGDVVVEYAGQGTDRVVSTVSYTLSANVENLTLTGSANLLGYGNNSDNDLTGNSGVNTLYGGAGNDKIDGGAGADRMYGGNGDDRYVVDNYGDKVVEGAGAAGGTDSVFSSADYKLGANVEKLTLTGSADIWGYGNDDDNVVSGNSGANKLYGMSGNDTVKGGDGNDWIEGGAGKDLVYGGAGDDSFVFRDGDFGGATAGTADRIADFTQGEDRIRLNEVDSNSNLGGDQAFHFIGTAAFDGAAGELRYEEVGGNTFVSGDTNGDGLADFMIRVDGLHALTTGDFSL